MIHPPTVSPLLGNPIPKWQNGIEFIELSGVLNEGFNVPKHLDKYSQGVIQVVSKITFHITISSLNLQEVWFNATVYMNTLSKI